MENNPSWYKDFCSKTTQNFTTITIPGLQNTFQSNIENIDPEIVSPTKIHSCGICNKNFKFS